MKSIFVWGINHQSDAVEARERLMRAIGPSGNGLAPLTPLPSDCREAVLLATCHRVEVYGVTEDDPASARSELIAQLAALSGLDPNCLESSSYAYRGNAAASHLFRVATGLDSIALGESQVLHQVKRAKETAEAAETIGPLLQQLFQRAIQIGKRARTETDINRHPISIASIGVDRAEHWLGTFQGKTALVVGAGKVASLAAGRLHERGVNGLRIANRQRETAAPLLAAYDASFHPLSELPRALGEVDCVVSASGSPEPLVRRSHVEAAVSERPSPLILVDLALPRDVDTDVATVPNVELSNVDDLQSVVQEHRDRREAEVAPIERMIADEVDRFAAWLKERDAASLICALRDRAEAIRADELQSTLRRLQLDDPNQEALVEQLSHRLINKLLHRPTVQIKHWAGNGHGLDRDDIADLFGLDDPESSPSRRDA